MSVTSGPEGFRWDDRLWQQVWERHLDPVERHRVARDVLARRWSDDVFHRSLAAELARQWRRTARVHAVMWSIWVAFWASLATHTPSAGSVALPWAMTTVGVVAVVVAVGLHRWLRGHAAGPPARSVADQASSSS